MTLIAYRLVELVLFRLVSPLLSVVGRMPSGSCPLVRCEVNTSLSGPSESGGAGVLLRAVVVA